MTSGSSRPDSGGRRAQWQAAWRLLTRPEEPVALPRETLADFARRLAELVGPGQAAAVLAAGEDRQGLGRLLPAAQVDQARLLALRSRHWQEQALRLLQSAGIETVVLKGLWLAERFYLEPLRRVGDDLDLLVRPPQLPEALRCLQQEGWHFAGATLPSWGSIARVSLRPLAAPDRSTAVDFHLEADEWPFCRALPNAAVFEQAMILERRGLILRGLSDE
ncbi:MAG TPA: nucleotidyltransferase family protein, partial [Kiloniellales bacterium]|nr:nucleotidyltransferase family protein [Kiloniellales bacterium]